LGGFLEAVLDQKVQVIALIQDLAYDPWVQRHETAGLAVLLGHQLLVERGDLDIEIEIGQIEIWREAPGCVSMPIPLDVEGGGFVVPGDLVKV
jgi:hypothetical protein